MAYNLKIQKRKVKKYDVYDIYTGKMVYSTEDKHEAKEFITKHRFRGDTSLRLKDEPQY